MSRVSLPCLACESAMQPSVDVEPWDCHGDNDSPNSGCQFAGCHTVETCDGCPDASTWHFCPECDTMVSDAAARG